MKNIIVILIIVLLFACTSKSLNHNSNLDRPVAALIDSIPILLDSVDQSIRQELYDELSRIHLIRKVATQQAIRKKLIELEAQKEGITIDELKENLYRGKMNKRNLINFIKHTSYPKAVPELRETLVFHDVNSKEGIELLTTRYKKYLVDLFVDSLMTLHNIKELLLPPTPPEINLENLITHFKGAPNAKVNFIVASDFDCHVCREQNKFFENLFEKYKDKLKYGFVPYGSYVSISAIAAECADNQGKFWEMHDSIFASPTVPDSTTLFRIANNLNMKMDIFKKDYENKEIKEKIRANLLVLESAGIYGTPTVLINSKPIFNNTSSDEIENLLRKEFERVY
jgi:hypothetical protein